MQYGNAILEDSMSKDSNQIISDLVLRRRKKHINRVAMGQGQSTLTTGDQDDFTSESSIAHH